jgi:hypothetical protein
VAVKITSQQPTEPVPGQPAEEDRRLTKPGDGARDIKGATTEPGIDVTGRIHDEVDQDLACDGDHALPLRRESVTGRPGRGHSLTRPALALHRHPRRLDNVRCAARLRRDSRRRGPETRPTFFLRAQMVVICVW